MNSDYVNTLIEQKYNGELKDSEWLFQRFRYLYFYLGEFINFGSENYLILQTDTNNNTDVSVTVVLKTEKYTYTIKATVLRDKDQWDDEHWLNMSSLRCMYSDPIRNEENVMMYSGVYSRYTWDIIKNNILSKECITVNHNLFA